MTTTLSSRSEAAIWERIISPKGPMTPETATHIVRLSMPADDEARMHDLAEKNRRDALTPEEEAELDNYCRVGTLLGILKSRARQILRGHRRTS